MGLLVGFAQLLKRQKAWLSMHRGLGAVDFPAGAVACCASCWEFSLAVVCEVGLGWKTVQDEAGMRDVWGPSVHTAALLLSSASQLHLRGAGCAGGAVAEVIKLPFVSAPLRPLS